MTSSAMKRKLKRQFTPLDPIFQLIVHLTLLSALVIASPVPSYNLNNNNNDNFNLGSEVDRSSTGNYQVNLTVANLAGSTGFDDGGISSSSSSSSESPENALWREKRNSGAEDDGLRMMIKIKTDTWLAQNVGSNMMMNSSSSSGSGSGRISTSASLNSLPSPENSQLESNSIVKLRGAHDASSNSSNVDNDNNNSSLSLKSGNCTLEPAFLCLVDFAQFQRDKDLRIQNIKNYVMHKLGFAPQVSSRPMPVDRPTFFEPITSTSAFSGQLQTLYASCDVPANVDNETWNSPDFFHIYFNLPPSITSPVSNSGFSSSSSTTTTGKPFLSSNSNLNNNLNNLNSLNGSPVMSDENRANEEDEGVQLFNSMIRASALQRRNGNNFGRGSQERRDNPRNSNFNVISAKLKLYKIGRPDTEKPAAEPCNNETTQSTVDSTNTKLPVAAEPVEDEKIRVSVYWYTQPVKKHHFKKKLLDTKMLSVKESAWVEFDVHKAVAVWLERRENFGLLVQVENEDNDYVKAKNHFNGLPCAIVRDVQNGGNRTEVVDIPAEKVLPPPGLEICTLTVPSQSPSSPGIMRQFSVPFSSPSDIIGNSIRTASNHNGRNTKQQSHNRHRHNHGDNRTHRKNHRNHHHQNQNQNQINQRQKNQMNIDTAQLSPLYSNLTTRLTPISTANENGNQNQNSDNEGRSHRFNSRNSSSNNNNGNNNNNDNDSNSNSGNAESGSSSSFKLDEDHPLREIFATVSSSNGGSGSGSSSSVSSTVKASPSISSSSLDNQDINYGDDNMGDETAVDDDAVDNEDDEDRDTIIQKIYISPPSPSNQHHHNHHHRRSGSSSSSRSSSSNTSSRSSSSSQVNSNLNR